MFWLIIVQFVLVFTVYFTIGEEIVVSKTIKPDIIKKDLEIYRNNLLNEKSLNFLTNCYNITKCCKSGDTILCPSYFELVRLFKVNNISTSDEKFLEQINQNLSLSPVNIDEFCEKFPSHIPNTTHYGPSDQQEQVLKMLSDQNTCKILCTEIDLISTKLKPLCAFISLLSEKLNSKKNVKAIITKKVTDSVKTPILKAAPVLMANLKNVSIKNDAVIKNSLNNVVNSAIKSSSSTQNNIKVNQDQDKIIKNSLNIVNSTIKSSSSTQNNIKINQDQDKIIKNNPPPTPPIETTTKIGKDTTVKNSNNKNLINEIQTTNNQIEQNQDQNDDNQIKLNVQNKNQQETDSNSLKNEDDLNSYIEENDSELEINTNTTYKSNLLNQIKNSAASGGIEEVNDEIDRTSIYKENLLSTDPFYEKSGSNFFFYFLVLLFISILMYVVYQNKTKILALLIEGRRSQKTKNRRKSSARYKRLDTTLEEAIISASTGHNTTQVIY